jgi:hypothetical protein
MKNPFKKENDSSGRCHQCGRPAIVQYGEGKEILLLCLDCNLKYQEANDMIQRRFADYINYLKSQIEFTTGIPTARYRVTTPIIHKGDIRLNNINVKNSVVGAINTGVVQSIDVSLTVMKAQGDDQIAEVIRELTEQILVSKQVGENQRSELLEQLSFLTEQLSKPKHLRKPAVIKPIFKAIGGALSGISNLLSIWEKLQMLLGL